MLTKSLYEFISSEILLSYMVCSYKKVSNYTRENCYERERLFGGAYTEKRFEKGRKKHSYYIYGRSFSGFGY